MSELLVKIAVLTTLTHGIRVLGRVAGPRRGSLLLGLPSTTAVALVACGQECGVAGAAEMAESSLFGLVAAVTLPLAFAYVLAAGRPLSWAAAGAVAAYLSVAWGSLLVPEPGAAGRLVLATSAVVAAAHLADRLPSARSKQGAVAPTQARCLVLRTVVPAACLAVVSALRETAGVRWAGLLSTFPGVTLTVLVVTYLEAGPAEAVRMARALPAANLGMIAFLGTFRFGCPAVGLGWGTACGYALAASTLLVIAALRRRGTAEPAVAATNTIEVAPTPPDLFIYLGRYTYGYDSPRLEALAGRLPVLVRAAVAPLERFAPGWTTAWRDGLPIAEALGFSPSSALPHPGEGEGRMIGSLPPCGEGLGRGAAPPPRPIRGETARDRRRRPRPGVRRPSLRVEPIGL